MFKMSAIGSNTRT